MNVRLTINVGIDELVEQLVQLSHEDFIKLVLAATDEFAAAELDEEIIARLYRGLEGCYDAEHPQPTIDELLEQYPAAEEGTDQ